MFLVSSCSGLRTLHWSQVLSWEWRCSWSSADRRCSNYIWVINNFISYLGATYIRGFTVIIWNIKSRKKCVVFLFHLALHYTLENGLYHNREHKCGKQSQQWDKRDMILSKIRKSILTKNKTVSLRSQPKSVLWKSPCWYECVCGYSTCYCMYLFRLWLFTWYKTHYHSSYCSSIFRCI